MNSKKITLKAYKILKKIENLKANSRLKRGRKFELYVSKLFNMAGFKAIPTQATCDRGIDILVLSPKGERIGVQCKHFRSSDLVNFSEAGSTYLGSAIYHLDYTIILTTGRFSRYAEHYAYKEGIHCWGKYQLFNLIVTALKINSIKNCLTNTNHYSTKKVSKKMLYNFNQLNRSVISNHDYKQRDLVRLICMYKYKTTRVTTNERLHVIFSNKFFYLKLLKLLDFGSDETTKELGISKMSLYGISKFFY